LPDGLAGRGFRVFAMIPMVRLRRERPLDHESRRRRAFFARHPNRLCFCLCFCHWLSPGLLVLVRQLRGPWRYGNFCGQGGKGLPINKVDTACMLHDYCYYQAGATALDNAWGHSAAVQACNQALCNRARSFENQNLPNSKEWWAAYQIDNFFTWGSTIGNSCSMSLLNSF
jgi:hypothetical protein